MAAFYALGDAPYPERLSAWAAAQQKVFVAYPEDIDAGSFAALAMLSVASPADQSLAVQRDAGELLERLHEQAPKHPGPYHYAIHAYDTPQLASLAERFAESYDQIAPEVPHALHMPSRIFVRLGRWPEGAAWNERSAAAAKAQPMEGDVISVHYPHAIDYLVYSLLQMGNTQTAAERLDALMAVPRLQDDFGSAYALSASPARLALEQDNWAAAAELPVAEHASIDWQRYPQAVAITWFAKGLGAAKQGDGDAAAIALENLALLRQTMSDRGLNYWVTLTDAQVATVEAWLALGEGRQDEALALMQKAAETEDSVAKAPVTPGHVLPARELLGDMLIELDRPAEARDAYEAAIAISPNRRRSVDGLGKLDTAVEK